MNVFPPTRFYALTYLVNQLREALQRGRWQQHLPSERQLAHDFNVGRSTLRSALRILAEEGLLTIRQGKPTLIHAAAPLAPDQQEFRSVMLVDGGCEEGGVMNPLTQRLLAQLRDRLIQAEVPHQQLALSPGGFRGPGFVLSVAEARASTDILWVVANPDARAEQWFSQYAARCTLVIGESTASSGLPSIGIDSAAVARHAANTLHQRGYEQLFFVGYTPAPVSLDLFRNALEEALAARGLAFEGITIAEGDSLHRMGRNLRRRLDTRAAVFVTTPQLLFPVLLKVAEMGASIPENLGMISLQEPCGLLGLPLEPAHYESMERKIVGRVTREIVDAIHLPGKRHTSILFHPEFFPAASLPHQEAGLRVHSL